MEIDISKQVNRILKYIIGIFLLLLVGTAGFILFYQKDGAYITLRDAQTAGVLVNAVTKVPGTVVDILVGDGDTVEAGQPLANLKVKVSPEQIEEMKKTVEDAKARYNELLTRPTNAAVQPSAGGVDSGAAQAALERAKRDKEKMDQLFAIGGISAVQHRQTLAAYEAALRTYEGAGNARVTASALPQENRLALLKAAELQVQQAQLALETARKDVQATQLTASVDGTVYFNGVQVGDEVSAGQTLFRVGDLHEVWVEAPLAAQQGKIRLGQFVEYTVTEYPGKQFRGTVYEIEERSNEAQSTISIVKISIPSDLEVVIRPGMKVEAKISV